MNRAEFFKRYGDVKVTFRYYYKFTFVYSATLPNGQYLSVRVGGNSDDIYRLEVSADKEESVWDLQPFEGGVSVDGVEIVSFEAY